MTWDERLDSIESKLDSVQNLGRTENFNRNFDPEQSGSESTSVRSSGPRLETILEILIEYSRFNGKRVDEKSMVPQRPSPKEGARDPSTLVTRDQ